jgi:hypothetical protein
MHVHDARVPVDGFNWTSTSTGAASGAYNHQNEFVSAPATVGDTCQPGYSNNGRGRSQYSDRMTCSALHLSVTDDGAVPVSRSEALSGQPAQGHYIIMLARGGGCAGGDDCFEEDFHFLRKDASGTWSWKLPNMPASDKDLEGRPITDPETAPLPGHYTMCGYYKVEPAKVRGSAAAG